jgi:hypothetical protein
LTPFQERTTDVIAPEAAKSIGAGGDTQVVVSLGSTYPITPEPVLVKTPVDTNSFLVTNPSGSSRKSLTLSRYLLKSGDIGDTIAGKGCTFILG